MHNWHGTTHPSKLLVICAAMTYQNFATYQNPGETVAISGIFTPFSVSISNFKKVNAHPQYMGGHLKP